MAWLTIFKLNYQPTL